MTGEAAQDLGRLMYADERGLEEIRAKQSVPMAQTRSTRMHLIRGRSTKATREAEKHYEFKYSNTIALAYSSN
jgi:hypothetical protein